MFPPAELFSGLDPGPTKTRGEWLVVHFVDLSTIG